jgi:hypothetical protein
VKSQAFGDFLGQLRIRVSAEKQRVLHEGDVRPVNRSALEIGYKVGSG